MPNNHARSQRCVFSQTLSFKATVLPASTQLFGLIGVVEGWVAVYKALKPRLPGYYRVEGLGVDGISSVFGFLF